MRILTLSLVFSLSFTSFIQVRAESSPLILSYEEWSSLSNDDQIQYLRGLQKVIAGMDDRSDYFAEAQPKMSPDRAPAAAKTPTLSADHSEEYGKLAASQIQEARELLEKADQEKNSEKKYNLLKKAADLTEKTRYGLTMISQPQVYSTGYEKWKGLHDELILKSKNSKKISADVERVSKIDTSFNNLLKYKDGSPEFDAARTEIRKNIKSYKTAKEEFTKAVAPPSNKNRDGNADKKTTNKKSPDKEIADKKVDKKNEEFFRCMYAGFVLKENCKAPNALPKNMSLLGIKKEYFVCDKSQVLCNPLLFGGAPSCPADAKTNKEAASKCLSEMKGFCKPKSSSATRDCLEEAEKNPQHLETTAVLIHANPEAWNDYTSSFHALCDEEKIEHNLFTRKKGESARANEERVKRDISQTCEWARGRLLKLRDSAKIDLKKIDGGKLPPTKNDKAVKGQK